MLMVIIICTEIVRKFYSTYLFGFSPDICTDIRINVHPTTSLICINIFINIISTTASIFTLMFSLTHCTNSPASFIYESHLIYASPHICIDVFIGIHLITASPNILINISIDIHTTTASIFINMSIDIQTIIASPDICIDIPQFSLQNCINLH